MVLRPTACGVSPAHPGIARGIAVDTPAPRCSNRSVPACRIAARIATIVVAIAVALAMPVSQFRTLGVFKSCCCPDPSNCHCPDHKSAPSPQPQMRDCHSTERTVIAPQLPAFAPPAIAVVRAPAVAVAIAEHPITSPHPAPPPTRPDAPS
jgi:hypothetical protein